MHGWTLMNRMAATQEFSKKTSIGSSGLQALLSVWAIEITIAPRKGEGLNLSARWSEFHSNKTPRQVMHKPWIVRSKEWRDLGYTAEMRRDAPSEEREKRFITPNANHDVLEFCHFLYSLPSSLPPPPSPPSHTHTRTLTNRQ